MPAVETKNLHRAGMQRFKTGDAIFILPRFGHLFSTHTGTVTAVKLDPFRSMFNEYTVDLDDGTTVNLFEFQLIEDELKYKTLVAAMIVDSHGETATRQHRGVTDDRHIVLRTELIDIDMTIMPDSSQASITGQILERASSGLASQAEVTLLKDNVPIRTTVANVMGIFKFGPISRGPLYVQVLIHLNERRVLGLFSI
jgi:hypothetical protein